MSEVVPDGWTRTTIGGRSVVKRGASPRPIKDPKWWGGRTGWVRISDVTSSSKYLTETKDYLSEEGVEKSVRIDKGEVILSICATIGRPIIVRTDACIHDGFVWFDDLDEEIDREFFYYFLSDKEDYLASQRQTGTQGNLNTGIVSGLSFLLPPKPEQQKIASILTSVDNVIEKTEAQIGKLQDLKRGMMAELLTRGIGHTEFKDSPVGRIPRGWEVAELNNLATVKHGFAFPGEHFSPQPSQFTLLTPGNFHKDGHLYFGDNTKYFTGEIPDDYILRNGDVLVVMTDLTKEMTILGNSVVLSTPRSVLHNQRIGKLELTQKGERLVTKSFLNLLLNSHFVKRHVKNTATGTTVRHTSPTKILEPFVPLPPIPEQDQMVDALGAVQIRMVATEKEMHTVEKLKKALMQDLLTGKVRVKVN